MDLPDLKPSVTLAEKVNSKGNISLIIIILVLASLIGAGSFYAYKAYKQSNAPKQASNISYPTIPNKNNPPQANSEVNNTTNSTSIDDTQLDRDLGNIDQSLGTMDSDLKNVDDGLNDKQGDLSS